MTRVHASVEVPAPPARAWATASDLTRFDEWLTLHESWRGEVPSVLAEGTTLTSVVAVMGLRNRVTWRIDRYTPPEGLTITGRGVGGVRIALALSVAPNGNAHSTVTIDADVTGRPVFGPVGMAIGRAVRTDLRKSVAALARLLT